MATYISGSGFPLVSAGFHGNLEPDLQIAAKYVKPPFAVVPTGFTGFYRVTKFP